MDAEYALSNKSSFRGFRNIVHANRNAPKQYIVSQTKMKIVGSQSLSCRLVVASATLALVTHTRHNNIFVNLASGAGFVTGFSLCRRD
jgi:hypothetical protein